MTYTTEIRDVYLCKLVYLIGVEVIGDGFECGVAVFHTVAVTACSGVGIGAYHDFCATKLTISHWILAT